MKTIIKTTLSFQKDTLMELNAQDVKGINGGQDTLVRDVPTQNLSIVIILPTVIIF